MSTTPTQFSAIQLENHHDTAEPTIPPPAAPSIPEDFQAIAHRVYTTLKPMLEKDPCLAPLLATANWHVYIRPKGHGRLRKLTKIIATPQLKITPLQRRILQLLACGVTATRISQLTGTSVHIVRNHRHQLMKLFDCRSSSDLVHYAIKEGLLPPLINRPIKPCSAFTPQERSVLQELSRNIDLTLDGLATLLGVQPRAVQKHITAIRRKLKVSPSVPKWRLPQLVSGVSTSGNSI